MGYVLGLVSSDRLRGRNFGKVRWVGILLSVLVDLVEFSSRDVLTSCLNCGGGDIIGSCIKGDKHSGDICGEVLDRRGVGTGDWGFGTGT